MALLTLLAALAGCSRWLMGVPIASAASSSDSSAACNFQHSGSAFQLGHGPAGLLTTALPTASQAPSTAKQCGHAQAFKGPLPHHLACDPSQPHADLATDSCRSAFCPKGWSAAACWLDISQVAAMWAMMCLPAQEGTLAHSCCGCSHEGSCGRD